MRILCEFLSAFYSQMDAKKFCLFLAALCYNSCAFCLFGESYFSLTSQGNYEWHKHTGVNIDCTSYVKNMCNDSDMKLYYS